MRKLIFVLALSLSLHAGTLSKSGNTLGASSAFSQSSVSVGVKLGSVAVGNESYTIAGLSANYFVIDDLSIGVGYEKWFSGNPDISKLTVESTYYFPIDKKIRPYAGLLYRHIMIGDDFNDIDSYGYRAGVSLVQDKLLLSAGIVQEKYDTDNAFLNGTQTHGEVSIGFMF